MWVLFTEVLVNAKISTLKLLSQTNRGRNRSTKKTKTLLLLSISLHLLRKKPYKNHNTVNV